MNPNENVDVRSAVLHINVLYGSCFGGDGVPAFSVTAASDSPPPETGGCVMHPTTAAMLSVKCFSWSLLYCVFVGAWLFFLVSYLMGNVFCV